MDSTTDIQVDTAYLKRHEQPAARGLRLFIALLFLLANFALIACSTGRASYPEPPRRGGDLFISAGLLKTDAPVFFSFAAGQRTVRFFVLRTDEGIIAFLDTCETCGPKKLGYRFDDGRLVCRACNQQYTPSEITHGFGGCYPIRLNGRAADDGFLIPVAELTKHAERF